MLTKIKSGARLDENCGWLREKFVFRLKTYICNLSLCKLNLKTYRFRLETDFSSHAGGLGLTAVRCPIYNKRCGIAHACVLSPPACAWSHPRVAWRALLDVTALLPH